MQVLDRLNEVRLPDHDIDIVRLVNGHHIPGKRRRGHTQMLPPARDSHVRSSESEQSSLRARRRGGRGASRAVLWHCEDGIIRYGNQTIVF
jgi:hypothetical protein